jgi:hypothetical protein
VTTAGTAAAVTGNIVDKIRKAKTVVQAQGYNPNVLAIDPAGAEALDLLVTGISGGTADYVFTSGQPAPAPWGLQMRVWKTAGTAILDADSFGMLYVAPVELRSFEQGRRRHEPANRPDGDERAVHGRAGSPTDAGLSLPCTRARSRFSRLARGCRDSVVMAVARSRRAARRGGRVDQVERRLPAVLRWRAADLVERPLPGRGGGVSPTRATRPRRGSVQMQTGNCAPCRATAAVCRWARAWSAWGPLATPVAGCLTAVRRSRDGPQPACRASPRARPACAPATARRPVLQVPPPSLRARRGRPRRG